MTQGDPQTNSTVSGDRRRVLAGAGALVVAPAMIGTARAADNVTWKVQAHWPKASASFGDSLTIIAQELEENTKGRFKLQLFGAGEFAKGAEIALSALGRTARSDHEGHLLVGGALHRG